MSERQPAGFSSDGLRGRALAVVRLARGGMRPRKIAKTIGIQLAEVERILERARR